MRIRACVVTGMTIVLFSFAQTACADMATYTDETMFDTALTTLGLSVQTTENFDSTAAGTLIANSSSLGAFTFSGLPAGAGVDNAFFTSSGSNYLGVASPSSTNFTTGGITFSFAPTNAFGMKMITSDKPPFLSNDDYTLTNGLQSVSIDSTSGTVVGGFPPFTNESYFFGIVNTDASFTSVTFNITSSDPLGYTVDDLRLASVIPEPGSISLLAILGLVVCNIRRRRQG